MSSQAIQFSVASIKDGESQPADIAQLLFSRAPRLVSQHQELGLKVMLPAQKTTGSLNKVIILALILSPRHLNFANIIRGIAVNSCGAASVARTLVYPLNHHLIATCICEFCPVRRNADAICKRMSAQCKAGDK